ncbi:MAG: sulfur carrier protein ThiS [Desulfobacteraceae bacterium]|nr:sulfur carrier protein ThiS [Desulfobacteraceae bacterium]
MELYLNGEMVETSKTTLDQLINEQEFDRSGLVVELNLKIIKKENWGKTVLKMDDRLECVTFVGGG